MIKAKIDDKNCKILLKGIEDNGKNLSRAMKTIAVELEESVRENFEVGGRYSKAGSIIGGPKKWPKSQYGGSLIRTGNLRDSITSKSDKTSAQVGTNIAYAKIHNFGATVAGQTIIPREKRALAFIWNGMRRIYAKVTTKTHDIPARPFMVVQPEDIEGFKETLIEHLTEGTK
ncbi:MAG: phage virion morphogenesis protein [Fibrobacter sp.]|nr:phage virion morphogenesis protein [Fibrobacter sp.]